MPQKWAALQVNTIQFEIDFIGICITHFNLTSTTRCTFTITQYGDKYSVILKSLTNSEEIAFEAKWIYIKQIMGYRRNS